MLHQKPRIHFLIIILLGSCIYANSIHVPFNFDDTDYIVNNPAIKNFSYFFDQAKVAELPILQDVKHNFILRPVAYLTFALNYRLHGLDLLGYHLVNILLHCTNALLLYRFFGLTLRTPNMTDRVHGPVVPPGFISYFPLFAALLFIAHPLQTQAVTYIVQRFVSLVTFFMLGAVVLYAEARLTDSQTQRRWLLVLSFVATLLAMKTKEIAFTLPVLLVLYEFMFFTGNKQPRVIRLLPFLATMAIIPWAVVSLATARHPASSAPLGSDPTNLVNFDNVSRWDYLMTQFGVIVTYVRLLVFPGQQNFDYDRPISHSLFSPEVLLPLLLLLVLCGTALWLWRRAASSQDVSPWYLVIAFGIIWFFVALSVESSIIPIEDPMVEHRVYLPSIGFFLALCGVIALVVVNASATTVRIIRWALLLVVILLGLATVQRNRVWAENVTLWQDVVRKSPNKPRAYDHLGFWLAKAGRHEEAVAVFRQGLALAPRHFNLQMHLGAALTTLNRLEEAVTAYEQATVIKPEDAAAKANLATICFKLGALQKGREAMKAAVALNPHLAGSLQLSLGIALGNRNQLEPALRAFQQAVALLPTDPQVHNNLATTYLLMGELEAGRRSLLQALELDPAYAGAHYNLGLLLEKEGKHAAALLEMEQALRGTANDAAVEESIVRLRKSMAGKRLP